MAPPPRRHLRQRRLASWRPWADGKKLDEQRAQALLEGKSKDGASRRRKRQSGEVRGPGCCAPAGETAARDLAERLKSRTSPHTEKVETKQDARYRVRRTLCIAR